MADTLLRKVLVTANFGERSRLLEEAISWHERAVRLAYRKSFQPEHEAKILPFPGRGDEGAS